MKLVFVEKKDQALNIVKGLGEKVNYKDNNRSIVSGDYVFTWGMGHLYELELPEIEKENKNDKNPKFFYTYDRMFKERLKARENAASYLNTIKKYHKEADEIINASDADREGQLIFDEIADKLKFDKSKISRVWISGVNAELIQRAFKERKGGPNSGPDNPGLMKSLGDEARARQLTDYNLNLNASSVTYSSLGRVKSPATNIAVKRYFEWKNFKKGLPSYKPVVKVQTPFGVKTLDIKIEENFAQKEDCERFIKDLNFDKKLNLKVETSQEDYKSYYDTMTLNAEIVSSLPKYKNLNMKQVQAIYEEGLYRKGFTSYPRTEIKFLENDEFIVKSAPIASKYSWGDGMNSKPSSTKWINPNKVEGHGGITTLQEYNGEHQEVYELILKRTVHTMWDKPKVLSLVATNSKLKNKTILTTYEELGYQKIYGKKLNEEEIEWIKNAKEVEFNIEIAEVEKKRPSLFTEKTLADALAGIDKEITDETQRKVLKKVNGIGTGATRAGIVATLHSAKNPYFVLEKGKLVPTERGLKHYELTKDKIIGTPEISGKMETNLSLINKGQISLEEWTEELKKINDMSYNELVNISLSSNSANSGEEISDCQCGGKVKKYHNKAKKSTFYRCSGCGKMLGGNHFVGGKSKAYTKTQVKEIYSGELKTFSKVEEVKKVVGDVEKIYLKPILKGSVVLTGVKEEWNGFDRFEYSDGENKFWTYVNSKGEILTYKTITQHKLNEDEILGVLKGDFKFPRPSKIVSKANKTYDVNLAAIEVKDFNGKKYLSFKTEFINSGGINLTGVKEKWNGFNRVEYSDGENKFWTYLNGKGDILTYKTISQHKLTEEEILGTLDGSFKFPRPSQITSKANKTFDVNLVAIETKDFNGKKYISFKTEFANNNSKEDSKILGKCSCGGDVVYNVFLAKCSNEDCDKKLFKKTIEGTKMDEEDILNMFTVDFSKIKNMKIKGKKYRVGAFNNTLWAKE